MLNQKGFAFVPILIWTAITLVGMGTFGAVAVKNNVISFDSLVSEKITHDGSRTGERVGYKSYCHPEQGIIIYENEKMPFTTDEGEQVLWTQGDIDCYKAKKLAEKTTPTSTPYQTTKNQQTNNTQVKITHDGSRTGKIVDYNSYCDKKIIKVYENELMLLTANDGKQSYSTRSDLDCYNRDLASNSLRNQSQTGNSYPPCTVYYPALGYSKTYNLTPSDCSYFQQRANTSSQPLSLSEIKAAPLPTVEPYQLSQEYIDAYNKSMQEINKDWKPTQVILPTPKCYATWEEYFKAHNMGNAPIYGNINSGPIPCD